MEENENRYSAAIKSVKVTSKKIIMICGISLVVAGLMVLGLIGALAGSTGGKGEKDEEDINSSTQGMTSTSDSAWQQLLNFYRIWEDDVLYNNMQTYVNAEGQECYMVKQDGGHGLAVGFGVDIDTHGSRITAAGYSTSEGSLVPCNVVDAIETEEFEYVKSIINPMDLLIYQRLALASRCLNYGIQGGLRQHSMFIYPSSLVFEQAYQYYYDDSRDDNYGDWTKTNFNHQTYTKYMTALRYSSDNSQPSGWVSRRKAEWCLFQTGYFGYDLKQGGEHGLDEYCILMPTGSPGEEGSTTVDGTTIPIYTTSSGKTYIMYDQTSGPWASKGYGRSTVSSSGCPTTAISAALSGLGFSCTPNTFLESRYYPPSVGTGNAINNYLTDNRSNYRVQEISNVNKSDLVQLIQQGFPIVVHVNGGDFTSSEHYMTLLDYNSSTDQFYVDVGASTATRWNGWHDSTKVMAYLNWYYKFYTI